MTDWPYGEPFKFGEHDPNWLSTLLQAYEERRVPWEKSMETRTLILERFLEMLDERGLSSHQYDEARSNHRVDHMIDIRKDGEWLARYNTAFLHRFSEGDMARELDNLKGQSMRVNGYQCDACCTVKSGENSLKDWFAVYDFRKGIESDEQHFCSLKCLGDWVEKQTIVLHDVIDPSRLGLWKEVKIVRAEVIKKNDEHDVYPDPSAMTKAERILHWIERTKWEIENDGNSPEISRLSVLVDDIEELCREKYIS